MGFIRRRFPEGIDERWLSLSVTTIGSFMSLLDSTIVNVGLPRILSDFHADVGRGQLILTIYLISLAIVIPLSGFLGERFGLKRLYIVTLFAFTASSALCACAFNINSLIIFRAMQGLGGGMLQPVGMAILFTLITPMERGRYSVVLGLPVLFAPLLGPTVGGYLVQYVSWRAIFLINVPVGILNLYLARRLLKETPIRHELKLDWRGFVLAAIALPSILVALSEGSDSGWTSGLILTLLVGGGMLFVTFIVWELRNADPLLQLRLFANRMFSLGLAFMFVTQFCFFGSTYLLSLFLQSAHGLGASETGLILLPTALVEFISMNISGRGYNRFGPRPFVFIGVPILIGTALALSQMNASTNVWLIAAVASLRGAGMAFTMMPVMIMTFNTVVTGQMGRASALQNVMTRIFGSASTAILTTILVVSLTARGVPAGVSVESANVPVHFLVAAFHDAFLAMAIVATISLGFVVFLHDGLLEKLKAEGARPIGEHEPILDEI